jgi:hypothetical protein
VSYLLLKCLYNLHRTQVGRCNLPALRDFVFLICMKWWLSQHAMAGGIRHGTVIREVQRSHVSSKLRCVLALRSVESRSCTNDVLVRLLDCTVHCSGVHLVELRRQLHFLRVNVYSLVGVALVLALEELPQRDDLRGAGLLLHTDSVHDTLLRQTLPLHDAQLHLDIVVLWFLVDVVPRHHGLDFRVVLHF